MAKTNVIFCSQPYPEAVSSTVEVTEIRAPTDASVALLREMEQKAKDEIVKSVHIKSNDFECVINGYREMMTENRKFEAIWSLNGKKHVTSYVATWSEDRAATAMGLRSKIAQEIAIEGLTTAFSSRELLDLLGRK